jgi:hypothetical protein
VVRIISFTHSKLYYDGCCNNIIDIRAVITHCTSYKVTINHYSMINSAANQLTCIIQPASYSHTGNAKRNHHAFHILVLILYFIWQFRKTSLHTNSLIVINSGSASDGNGSGSYINVL